MAWGGLALRWFHIPHHWISELVLVWLGFVLGPYRLPLWFGWALGSLYAISIDLWFGIVLVLPLVPRPVSFYFSKVVGQGGEGTSGQTVRSGLSFFFFFFL